MCEIVVELGARPQSPDTNSVHMEVAAAATVEGEAKFVILGGIEQEDGWSGQTVTIDCSKETRELNEEPLRW